MAILGKKREQKNFETSVLEVGLMLGKVVAINPSKEEYKEILGMELKEDSKATDYLGEKDGNTTLRIDVWLEKIKPEGEFKKVTFFLENKVKSNKDNTKTQKINAVGSTSWASESALPAFFVKHEWREAFVGEEELYNFVRTWLGGLDLSDADSAILADWKQLMKGKLTHFKEQIGGEYATNVVVPVVVRSVVKEGETKEYQSIYNKAVLPEYALKQFRVIDYTKDEVLDAIKRKDPKTRKIHEKFVIDVAGEYGCKDTYLLKDLRVYNPADFLVGSNEPISNDGADY